MPAQRSEARQYEPVSRGKGFKRIALAVAATLVSVNIWTGAPLMALWVGSRVVPSSGLSLGTVLVIVAVLVVEVLALTVLLTHLNAAYDHLGGKPTEARRRPPWLRTLRESEEMRRTRVHSNPIEVFVVASVVGVLIAYEIWFFFFAHFSLPGG